MTAALADEDRAARDERIVTLTRAGYSAPHIADILRISERTVQRVRVRTGISMQPPPPLTGDEILRAADLLDDGASYTEVARTLGRSLTAIRRRFHGRSCWAPGSGYQYREMARMLDAIIPPINWEVFV